MQIHLNTSSPADYQLFLKIKSLPAFKFQGRTAIIPSEYQHLLMPELPKLAELPGYKPIPSAWDYQAALAALSVRKEKFALFLDCGLGKSLIEFEFARYVSNLISPSYRVLIITPLMVVPQMIDEVNTFYKNAGYTDFTVEQVRANRLKYWTTETGSSVGITNYDALDASVPKGRLGSLILDESSMLKSSYGKHAQDCIRLGEGLRWKLCASGTPAPNDRIEYANHAIFLDQYPNINSFLSRFFVNKGKTGERWEIKPHAVEDFYRDLSHWSIFMTSPAVYGFKDNANPIPPYKIIIHDVDLTDEQKVAVREKMGTLFACDVGGVVKRGKLSQIAKGNHNGKKISTFKPRFIKNLVDSWPDRSTIIWCEYNAEQQTIEEMFPHAASITGTTPYHRRIELIEGFKNGKYKQLITKGKILGFGLNLQICTRQVFSGLVDSYEKMYQCIKRSNRYGSTESLEVHIPVTDAEMPMINTVLAKARRIDSDTEIQQNMFKGSSYYGFGDK